MMNAFCCGKYVQTIFLLKHNNRIAIAIVIAIAITIAITNKGKHLLTPIRSVHRIRCTKYFGTPDPVYRMQNCILYLKTRLKVTFILIHVYYMFRTFRL